MSDKLVKVWIEVVVSSRVERNYASWENVFLTLSVPYTLLTLRTWL